MSMHAKACCTRRACGEHEQLQQIEAAVASAQTATYEPQVVAVAARWTASGFCRSSLRYASESLSESEGANGEAVS